MQRSTRIALVPWGILAWPSVSMAAAQSFDAATRTVTVTPSGVDDTRALRTAFDIREAVGPSCTVQLEAGTFRTHQLEVWGFRGTFAGAGMHATVVETLAPLPISPPDLDLAVRFWTPAGGPVFIAFRNAHMTMRDLTVRNDAFLPTVGWTHGGFRIRALVGLLWFEGDDLRVDMERVAIESGRGDLDGFSVLNGLFLQGPEAYPGSPVPDMVGVFTFRDGRIDGPEWGLVVSNVEAYSVVVRDSVVAGAIAVGLTDAGETPTQFVIVERNVIEVDADASAAVGGEGDGLVLCDNVFVGTARLGVQVGVGRSVGRPRAVAGDRQRLQRLHGAGRRRRGVEPCPRGGRGLQRSDDGP